MEETETDAAAVTESGDVQKPATAEEAAGREGHQRIPVLVQKEAQTSPPLSPPAPGTPDKVMGVCRLEGKEVLGWILVIQIFLVICCLFRFIFGIIFVVCRCHVLVISLVVVVNYTTMRKGH